MKVVIVNGLLKKEKEMKKILELVSRELDKNEIYFEKINLYDTNLSFYEGETNFETDQIFNTILSSDAVILVSSVHTGNVTAYLKNFMDYFEIAKYKNTIKHKMILPVLLYNVKNYVSAYNSILNMIDDLELLEVNKINLSLPDIMNDSYVEASMKYIRIRINEFCNMLMPNRSVSSINNEKLNQMLEKQENVVDEKQIKLDIDEAETDIKDLANMVNEKLLVKEIVDEDKKESKDETISTIASKYKSKIEEIMQETLGDEDAFDEIINSTNEEINEIEVDAIEEPKDEGLESTIEIDNIEEIKEPIAETVVTELQEVEETTPNITIEKAADITMGLDIKKVKVDPRLSAEEKAREYIRNSVMAREGKTIEKYVPPVISRKDNIVSSTNNVKEVIQVQRPAEVEETVQVQVPQSTIEISKYQFNHFANAQEVVPYEEKIDASQYIVDESQEESDKLKDTTKNLAYLFKAPENEKLNVLMQVNVSGDEPMNIYINIEDNKCSIFEGINVNSDVTVDVASDKWKKILAGETTLQKAFMTGMIKVIGNFVMLSKLDKSLFAYTNK